MAYARQMRSVSPEIIDDIATDFRLGVQTARVEEAKVPDDIDVRKAAKTLLELYGRLQAEQKRGRELTTRMRMRVPES